MSAGCHWALWACCSKVFDAEFKRCVGQPRDAQPGFTGLRELVKPGYTSRGPGPAFVFGFCFSFLPVGNISSLPLQKEQAKKMENDSCVGFICAGTAASPVTKDSSTLSAFAKGMAPGLPPLLGSHCSTRTPRRACATWGCLPPRLSTQKLWWGREFAFLMSPQMMLVLLVPGHTARSPRTHGRWRLSSLRAGTVSLTCVHTPCLMSGHKYVFSKCDCLLDPLAFIQ